MRSITRCLLLSLSLSAPVFWPASARAEPPPSSEFTLEHFYRWVLAHPGAALPTAKGRSELASLLSPQLIALLKDASDTEARCVKTARKDEKPLLMEGDLFVGSDGGATEVAYGSTSQLDNGAINTTMHLFAVDKRFAKGTVSRTVAWVDNVQLRQQGRGMWLVHDIQFAETRSLVASLQSYIADGAQTCVAAKR